MKERKKIILYRICTNLCIKKNAFINNYFSIQMNINIFNYCYTLNNINVK